MDESTVDFFREQQVRVNSLIRRHGSASGAASFIMTELQKGDVPLNERKSYAHLATTLSHERGISQVTAMQLRQTASNVWKEVSTIPI